MSEDDAGRGTSVGDTATAPSTSAPEDSVVLAAEEKKVLEVLVASKTARTVAQVSGASGLSREQVVTALEGLRAKGLATRLNTVIESYAARFPGVEV